MKVSFKLNQSSFKKASKNAEDLFDKVARKAKERALRKAARPGLVATRAAAKAIPELGGNTKGIRLAVRSYRQTKITLAYVGWDSKVPITWLGRTYKSARHGGRVEFGGTVIRGGRTIRTRPYGILRKAIESKKAEMERIFVQEVKDLAMKEALKLNK